VALAMLGELRRQGLTIEAAAIRSGVRQVRWPGRLEWRGEGRLLLDGAHNGAGARVLADYLRSVIKAGIHLVIGIKGDKQAEAILAPLLPLATAVYCTVPPVEEAVPPVRLAELAAGTARPATLHAAPLAAVTAALAARRNDEVVVVAGSLFLVAEVRDLLARGEVAI
jgi:dihydrofolate synthase/folylpolyglutamate synthase